MFINQLDLENYIILECMNWGGRPQGGVEFRHGKHTVVRNCDSKMPSQPIHEQYSSMSLPL